MTVFIHFAVYLQVVAVLLFLFMVFFLHMSDSNYNVWGHEGASKMADVAVKMAMGVYLIDWAFRATSQISGRMPLWPVLVLGAAGFACLLAFCTTDNVYTTSV